MHKILFIYIIFLYCYSAILHAGIGYSVVENVLAALNLPSVHQRTLKKREREAGRAIETVANKSCDEAIDKEKELMSGYVVYG